MRGANLDLTPGTVVGRALSQIYARPAKPTLAPPDWVPKRIAYRLEGGYNGGKDPTASHCASWSYGRRTPTADCIGFALWAVGIDRLQPGYVGSRGEWLNCDAILDDAHGSRRFFRPVGSLDGRPGDLLVSGAPDDGRHGHIGVIIAASATRPDPGELQEVTVVDCSPRHGRDTAIDVGGSWSRLAEIVRPVWYL